LRAAQLGSPLVGVLTAFDAQGKQLARADGTPAQADPVLSFTAPADGVCRVQVEDRFRSRGGPDFAYRLGLTRGAGDPDFRLQLAADTVSIIRSGTAKVRVTADRQGGFKEAIELAVEGLPEGVKVSGTRLDAGKPQTELVFTAAEAARIDASRLRVSGKATVAGAEVTR